MSIALPSSIPSLAVACGAALVCLAAHSVAHAQASGLRTSFDFPVVSSVAAEDGLADWRQTARFDFSAPLKGVAFGAPRLTWPLARAEVLTGTGPLSLASSTGAPLSFDSASPLRVDAARYRLESSRLTLRAPVYEDENWTVRVGATGLSNGIGLSALNGRPASGLSPMWHASAERRIGEKWSLIGDLNVAASRTDIGNLPVDMALRAAYDWDRDWSVTGGYRLVDNRNGSMPGLTGIGGVSRVQSLTLGVRRSF